MIERFKARASRAMRGRSIALVVVVALGCSNDEAPRPRDELGSPRSTAILGVPAPGVDAVTDVAALPLLRLGGQTLQVSSADPAGGNEDGFAGHSELYVEHRYRIASVRPPG